MDINSHCQISNYCNCNATKKQSKSAKKYDAWLTSRIVVQNGAKMRNISQTDYNSESMTIVRLAPIAIAMQQLEKCTAYINNQQNRLKLLHLPFNFILIPDFILMLLNKIDADIWDSSRKIVQPRTIEIKKLKKTKNSGKLIENEADGLKVR